MNLIDPLIYEPYVQPVAKPYMEKKEETNPKDSTGLDFSFFRSDKAANIKDSSPAVPVEGQKRRGRPKSAQMDDRVDQPAGVSSYANSYSKTNMMLESAIAQTDQLATEVKSDIDTVRSNKTLKNKYTYITNLTASAASLIATKVNAIREMDSNITQGHKLDLDRSKIEKDSNNQNDDMRMMDLYSAFVNAPMGSYNPNQLKISDAIIGVNGAIGPTSVEIPGVENATGPLTPEQMAMRLENNPNITTVVRFDNSTGNRFFDVVDSTTGASIPNVPRPDQFLLEDTVIDTRTGTARNRNLNKVWPLIVMNSDTGSISEY